MQGPRFLGMLEICMGSLNRADSNSIVIGILRFAISIKIPIIVAPYLKKKRSLKEVLNEVHAEGSIHYRVLDFQV